MDANDFHKAHRFSYQLSGIVLVQFRAERVEKNIAKFIMSGISVGFFAEHNVLFNEQIENSIRVLSTIIRQSLISKYMTVHTCSSELEVHSKKKKKKKKKK